MRKAISGVPRALIVMMILLGMLMLPFNTQTVKAQGTIYIRSDGSIMGTTDIQTVDNVTYVFTANISDNIIVQRDNITIDGNGYTLQGAEIGIGNGRDLSGRTNVTVENATIKSFEYGILYSSSSNSNISARYTINLADLVTLAAHYGQQYP